MLGSNYAELQSFVRANVAELQVEFNLHARTIFVSLLSFSHSHTHTHTHTRTHIHILSHTHTLSFSLSRAHFHTRTHTHTHFLFLTHSPIHFFSTLTLTEKSDWFSVHGAFRRKACTLEMHSTFYWIVAGKIFFSKKKKKELLLIVWKDLQQFSLLFFFSFFLPIASIFPVRTTNWICVCYDHRSYSLHKGSGRKDTHAGFWRYCCVWWSHVEDQGELCVCVR